MDESTVPFGKNEKRQSANEKIFELTTASSAYFFIHILPLLVLSKVGCVRWGGDKSIYLLSKKYKYIFTDVPCHNN
jgi:hypothetical protein